MYSARTSFRFLLLVLVAAVASVDAGQPGWNDLADGHPYGSDDSEDVSAGSDVEESSSQDVTELPPGFSKKTVSNNKLRGDTIRQLIRILKMAALGKDVGALKLGTMAETKAATSAVVTETQVSTLARYLTVGESMAEAVLSGTSKVQIRVTTENFCNWALGDPVTHNHGGIIKNPAKAVAAGTKEAMFSINMMVWQGSFATVTWDLDVPSLSYHKRVALMWSGPYYFNPTVQSYRNTLAVGIIEPDFDGEDLFLDMYQNPGSWERGTYSSSTDFIHFCDEKFCVRGTMGTEHTSEVMVQVYPKYSDSLATALQPYYYRMQFRG